MIPEKFRVSSAVPVNAPPAPRGVVVVLFTDTVPLRVAST
jgi:hypothetical protein